MLIGKIFASLFGAIIKTIFSPVVVLGKGKWCIVVFYSLGLLQALGLYAGFYLEIYLILATLAFTLDEFIYLNGLVADRSYKTIYWALKGMWWWAGFYYLWFVLWH